MSNDRITKADAERILAELNAHSKPSQEPTLTRPTINNRTRPTMDSADNAKTRPFLENDQSTLSSKKKK